MNRTVTLAVAAAAAATLLAGPLARAAGEVRLEIGDFTATRLVPPPVIDGKVAPGEWDHAMTTSGMMAPFEHELQTAETTMSLGSDAKNFYFLFRCRRTVAEWYLAKTVRLNDDYNYGDPSIEIWVTPPTLVPETYQSIINTYPAVFDVKMIPTRGYTGQGWKGNWTTAVTETPTDYVIEASIPIKDFGFDAVKNGDVWRFLLCRTAHGARPRSQASWSITLGFSEIPQHPQVHFMDDEAVLQVFNVTSVFTGKYEFPMAVAAPRGQGAEVDVEVRFHKGQASGAADDRVEKKHLSLKAGERQPFTLAGDVTDLKAGNFTISATKADGARIFRQSFPFTVNGWTPQAPQRPANVPPPPELNINAQYGPETNTVLVKADILDLTTRAKAAAATVKIVDTVTGKTLSQQAMGPFIEWYSQAQVRLQNADIPAVDFKTMNALRAKATAEAEAKAAAEPPAAGAKPGAAKKPVKVPPIPLPVTPRKVTVEVTVADKDGNVLKTSSSELSLLRYAAEWTNNKVGITDKVIPPWTPVTVKGADVGVWNRTLKLNGLGLSDGIVNGGTAQLATPMRLVAVVGGQETEIAASKPKLKRQVEAEVDLTGSGTGAGLAFTAATRVEFDGFTKLDWTFGPAGKTPVKVDQLYLEVTLPAAEATHFCTTAGGWTAVHDALPDYWTSQATASGMLIGDWVPYIWLTNSDRAFLWFADSDKGWSHDPDKKLPTQEIKRENGQVRLRVHFIEIPTELTAARTLSWGYQTFPSRPLPDGWRAMFCNQRPPMPHTTNTYFWFEADWAVLWPYYCSPYPWSMEKSKTFYEGKAGNPLHRPCVGSIAHSIGRYRDYDGNEFPGLMVDWGATPGVLGNADVTSSKGPNDFRVWHYQRWVREAGFAGLYIDENYLGLEENFLTGNAYYLPDGRLQRGYNYLGLRDYFKRMMVMFHDNNVPRPNLWQHISGGAAYNAWFGDIFFEGENVEPTDLNFDYIEVLPAGRMRSIGSAACSGGAMTMMCQSQRHRSQWWEKHTHQFVGWILAHDILPEQVDIYPVLCEVGRLWEKQTTFQPYWKPETPFRTTTTGCVVSAHATPDRALLWVVNTSRQAATVAVTVDYAKAGLDPQKTVAVNAETGAPITLQAGGFNVAVVERDFVPVLLVNRGALGENETLVATFERGVEADQAVGSGAFAPAGRVAPDFKLALTDGATGKALALPDAGVTLHPHLNLASAAGRISLKALLPDKPGGTLISLGPLSVRLKAGQEPVAQLSAGAAQTSVGLPGAGWHTFDLSWSNGKARLAIDGKAGADIAIGDLGLAPKGLVWGNYPQLAIGQRTGIAAIDDVRCSRGTP